MLVQDGRNNPSFTTGRNSFGAGVEPTHAVGLPGLALQRGKPSGFESRGAFWR
jgi:hypothetical protein